MYNFHLCLKQLSAMIKGHFSKKLQLDPPSLWYWEWRGDVSAETSLSQENVKGEQKPTGALICWLRVWILEDQGPQCQGFVTSYFVISISQRKESLKWKGPYIHLWREQEGRSWGESCLGGQKAQKRDPVVAAIERKASLGPSAKRKGEFGELAWA